MSYGQGAAAFGCADGLECLSISRGEKYCHNGGMDFAHHGSRLARVAEPQEVWPAAR